MSIAEANGQTIRILHLYHDLMNLYGDWANPAALAGELLTRGLETVVEKKSVGDDIDLGLYDFLYIGSGTERSQRACMRDMARFASKLIERIESGLHVLATGNAHELFGRAVTTADGQRFEALGIMDFETVQTDARLTGDSVCRASFLDEKLIGFINRAGGYQEGQVKRPFIPELGPDAEGGPSSEGVYYKNVLGTYMTGPILVRNPPLLKYFAHLLCPDYEVKPEAEDLFFDFQEKAYASALAELLGGIKNKK